MNPDNIVKAVTHVALARGIPPSLVPATIEYRSRRVINTDPQRRCYHGANFSEALVWTEWETLEFTNMANVEERLKFWRELNDYAVSQRGVSAKSEFRIKE